MPVPSESRAACAQPDAAARKRCNGRECWRVCCREKPRAHPDTEAGTNRLAKPAPTARNPAEEPAGELHRRFARRSCGSSFCSALTLELSRAAKRRRLGRTVRAQGSRKRRQRGARAHARRPHAVACTVREPSRLRATRCGRKETLQRARVLEGLLPREATGAPRYRGRHEPVGEAGADRQKPSGRTGGRVAPALHPAQLRKQLLQRPNA